MSLLIFLVLGVIYLAELSGHPLYLYSFLPGSARYSELLGYGNDAFLRPAMHLVWWGLLVYSSRSRWGFGTGEYPLG